MDSLLTFKNVSFRYPSFDDVPGELAINGLDLTVKHGEFIAVLGHNGSGKSTFAKLCNAVLTPVEGDILVGGINTRDEANLLKIRSTVGMVFQNPDNQIVATLVEEDVAFALENLGVPPEEIRRRVDEALKMVGMYDYREHAPHRLSGGQKQRVAIAGVVAMRPQCIVFDEPTAMLDPSGRREVMETAKMLNRDLGITIILITHHMEEAALGGRVLVFDKGEIIKDGTPREVFAEYDMLKKHSLSVPQTVELTHMLSLPPALDTDECVKAVINWYNDAQADCV